ncbi:peptide transporter family 1-like [Ctenocephalides felis]|uniref:peptide transporter family 1-like n=1 Tax=Ctenocephalides felis TaxID=7515 RepID=UPI000E6E47EA|nr:peptide transporter family 1-like [Ctenocephalides felis]
MDGQLGSFSFLLEHYELMQPLLAIIIMPICDHVIDHVIKPWKLDRTFRRMIFGGLMISIAFLISGILETCIKSQLPPLPTEKELQIRIFNGFNCTAVIQSESLSPDYLIVNPFGMYSNKHVPYDSLHQSQSLHLSIRGSCFSPINETIDTYGGIAIPVMIRNEDGQAVADSYQETLLKSASGLPILTVVGADIRDNVVIRDPYGSELSITVKPSIVAGHSVINNPTRTYEVDVSLYDLYLNGAKIMKLDLDPGGVYLVTLVNSTARVFVVTKPNSVHVLWMLPQAAVLILGEIYFSITYDQFIYTEAPMSCKIIVAAFHNFFTAIVEILIENIVKIEGIDVDHKLYLHALLLILSMLLLFIVRKRFRALSTNNVLF